MKSCGDHDENCAGGRRLYEELRSGGWIGEATSRPTSWEWKGSGEVFRPRTLLATVVSFPRGSSNRGSCTHPQELGASYKLCGVCYQVQLAFLK